MWIRWIRIRNTVMNRFYHFITAAGPGSTRENPPGVLYLHSLRLTLLLSAESYRHKITPLSLPLSLSLSLFLHLFLSQIMSIFRMRICIDSDHFFKGSDPQ